VCHVAQMGRAGETINDIADEQRQLVTRSDIVEVGGSDGAIRWRLRKGVWVAVQPGVYQADRRPLDWETQLLAAVLAAGDRSVVSHRSAFCLWELDGIATRIVELTVPYTHGPAPKETIVHRTRRPIESVVREGIPVTTVERTLLDCSAMLPRIVIGKALDSAIRRNLTTVDRVYDLLVAKGGRGVKGPRTLRWVVSERLHDTATGSGSEFELLYHMQMAFLPRPELQYPLLPENGRRVPDFYWPMLRKAVEVDGIDAHSSADRLDDDLKRQNELLNMGIELRRFSAREIRRNPDVVVEQIRQFLES
jgi:hypothetical protein